MAPGWGKKTKEKKIGCLNQGGGVRRQGKVSTKGIVDDERGKFLRGTRKFLGVEEQTC